MAKLIYTYVKPTREKDLLETKQIIENDGIIAYPTDVNWAFGCDSTSSKALERLRQLKSSHPKDQPFSLLCNSISMVSQIAQVEHTTFRFLKRLWPGPYTILLKSTKLLHRRLKDKRELVGVRIPDSPLLLDLIAQLNRPLITTSLPISPDGCAPRFGYEIEEIYGHALDLILDLGEDLAPNETTVIDFSEEGQPQILREGAGDLAWFASWRD